MNSPLQNTYVLRCCYKASAKTAAPSNIAKLIPTAPAPLPGVYCIGVVDGLAVGLADAESDDVELPIVAYAPAELTPVELDVELWFMV